MTTVSAPRDNLLLQRFLSLFLLAGALPFGAGTFVSAANLISGDFPAFVMLLGCGLPTGALLWLGTNLWSGRGVPRIYLISFLLLLTIGPFLLAPLCKTWEESWTLMAMALPTTLSVYPVFESYLKKPSKPAAIHEL